MPFMNNAYMICTYFIKATEKPITSKDGRSRIQTVIIFNKSDLKG